MKRILVTGGAGYIGSHTVLALLDRGYDVTVLDNLSMGHKAAVSPDRLVVGDLKDADALDHLLLSRQIEGIIHFAASASVGESVTDPAKYYRNNVTSAIVLLEAARRQSVKNFVFSSTCAVYGIPASVPITEDLPMKPISPYGRTKLVIEMALEDYAHAYGMSATALRYFNAAGADSKGRIGEDHRPETHLIPLLLQSAMGGEPISIFGTDYPTPDGTCIRDYIHVEDLASAHVLALEKQTPGRMGKYNLGTGQGCSIREMIALVESITGRKVPFTEGARREGDPPELVASPALAMKELGWRPKYPEPDGIVETAWKWQSAHPKGYGR